METPKVNQEGRVIAWSLILITLAAFIFVFYRFMQSTKGSYSYSLFAGLFPISGFLFAGALATLLPMIDPSESISVNQKPTAYT